MYFTSLPAIVFTNDGAKVKYFKVLSKQNNVFNNILTLALMVKEERKKRLDKAIDSLIEKEMIDAKDVIKDITGKTGYHPNNVRAALRGEERYLNEKFVKKFCASFRNSISAKWIWEGIGSMTEEVKNDATPIELPSNLDTWEKEPIISLLHKIVDSYNKTIEDHANLRREIEEITRRDQENFKYLMEQIAKHV